MGETALLDLKEFLGSCRRAVLLFSGGLDSSLLLAAGVQVLGDRLTALTFTGPHTAPGELAAAFHLARRLGVRHIIRRINPLELPDFRRNTRERCYACKKTVIRQGWEVARALDAEALWDGTNRDDLADFRPGLRAAEELGIRSPLLEAGLGKAEIREVSRSLGLDGDRPSQSCLATRFPYDTELREEDLARVGRAEAWLRSRGFSYVRLRVRGEGAVLELDMNGMARFSAPEIRRPFQAFLRGLGWGILELCAKT